MSAFQRQISENISDQQTEGTCYAHSIARIILNAIRQTIPEQFYPMESDMCNQIYWLGTFNTVSEYIRTHSCGEHSANNILMFAYIYNTIVNKYGCEGGDSDETLGWYSQTYIKTEFGTEDSIRSALPNIVPEDLERIKRICSTFSIRFFREQNNTFVFHSQKIKDITDLSIFRFVLDNGYYIGVSGKNHIVTAVGFKEHFGHLLILLKNSWGKLTSFDAKLRAPISQGISTMTIDRIIEGGFDRIVYIIPNNLSDVEREKVKRKQVMNELIDRDRRKKITQNARVGGKKNKKRKTKKINKRKSRKYKK
jgi:hypothetical protein